MTKYDIECKFKKVCINEHDANPKLYKRKDYIIWAKEAAERGDKYFYTEPVDPKYYMGRQKLSNPKYRYELSGTLTEAEFRTLFPKYEGGI